MDRPAPAIVSPHNPIPFEQNDTLVLTRDRAFLLALQYHQGGILEDAEAIYRAILQNEPDDADSLHMLGVLAHQANREIASDLVNKAIALRPTVARYHYNLGVILSAKGLFDNAIKAFRTATELKGDFTEAKAALETLAKREASAKCDSAAPNLKILVDPGFFPPSAVGSEMKMAILVSGQCRTLDRCFKSIQVQVLRHFPKAELWISVAEDADAKAARLFENSGLPIRLFESLEQPTFDEKDYRERSRGGMYEIGGGLKDRDIVQRVLRQAWHLRHVFDLASSSGVDYTSYMRLRPDQWFSVGVARPPKLTPCTAFVPWWGGFGGVNDRFAILDPIAADAYCYWPRLDELLAEGCQFHPETLTKHGLDRIGATIVHLPVLATTLKRDKSGKLVKREPEILVEETMPFLLELMDQASEEKSQPKYLPSAV